MVTVTVPGPDPIRGWPNARQQTSQSATAQPQRLTSSMGRRLMGSGQGLAAAAAGGAQPTRAHMQPTAWRRQSASGISPARNAWRRQSATTCSGAALSARCDEGTFVFNHCEVSLQLVNCRSQ
jgi:hypothetical protein